MKIAHVTSAHPRNDIRIFHKMCLSLANSNYDITLFVADGLGDDNVQGVKIFDVGRPANRLTRFVFTPFKLSEIVKRSNYDIIQLHDPDLLLVAKTLNNRKQLVFDSHESVGEQILTKHYIPKLIRKLVSKLYMSFETKVCRDLGAIICATDTISEQFVDRANFVTTIANYPIFGEFSGTQYHTSKKKIVYAGVISEERGILVLLDALTLCEIPVKLVLMGRFANKKIEREVRAHKTFVENVEYLGQVERSELAKNYSEATCGIVTFQPGPNHTNSMPNKLFEYMSASLPVVASNLPLWSKIVNQNACGICVDPTDPVAIARGIDEIVNNPQKATQMGSNGLQSVLREYNWNTEFDKLLITYERISQRRT